MHNKTTAAVLGALTIGVLAWMGAPAGAGPDSNRSQVGSGGSFQQKKPWGCEDSVGKPQCILCCIAVGKNLLEACVGWGLDEDYCQSKAQQAIDKCEGASCGSC